MTDNNNVKLALTGVFKNTLGSIVELSANDDFSITGTYRTGVGSATQPGKVVGSWAPGKNCTAIVGWTVCWKDVQEGKDISVCSWSGKLNQTKEKTEIETTWLLTADTEPQKNWNATSINKDYFTKVVPAHN
eukprot:CAMPEP_0168563924 /NCGR_PEP_ID=MMETSP0413-20121227/12943_1 /TAXON_ID=136452 /ORGANISM="Filamoeba nolandi, Strain NC-AS-23-1" /LENGTH=131 /DNA_ID=CAMNT_0008595505 /DNA_START=14 /DNA_END=409 /DNA_ORIENTATION=+